LEPATFQRIASGEQQILMKLNHPKWRRSAPGEVIEIREHGSKRGVRARIIAKSVFLSAEEAFTVFDDVPKFWGLYGVRVERLLQEFTTRHGIDAHRWGVVCLHVEILEV